GTERPSHKSREVVFTGPDLGVFLRVIFCISAGVHAADVAAANGDHRPFAVIPLREKNRERPVARWYHHFNRQLCFVFRPEGQLQHTNGGLTILLFTQRPHFEVFGLRWIRAGDVVLELFFHPLALFLPLLHGFHRDVLSAFI